MLYVRYMPIHPNLTVHTPLMDAVVPVDEPRTAAAIVALKADLAEIVKERWPSTRNDTTVSLEITLHHWMKLDG